MVTFWIILFVLVNLVVSLPTHLLLIPSNTTCFTFNYDVAINEVDQLIYYHSRHNWNNTTWIKLDLPKAVSTEEPPKYFVSIKCDGNDLVVQSQAYYLYFYRFSTEDGKFPFGWQHGVGRPIAKALYVPPKHIWLISQRGLENYYYTDIAGNKHISKTGCDGFMYYQKDTNSLHLIDNWSLPNFTYFAIDLPYRNRFIPKALSVSASMLMIISESGLIYTRLADFDLMGFDPLIEYTYKKINTTKTVLPFSWVQQPSIVGPNVNITSQIVIIQNGQGNNARELRVVGTKDNVKGYFSKSMISTKWSFIPTEFVVIDEPFLENNGHLILTKNIFDMQFVHGPNITLYHILKPIGEASLELHNYQTFCSPATLKLTLRTTSYKLEFNSTVHHRPQWPSAEDGLSFGAIEVSKSLQNSTFLIAQIAYETLFASIPIFDIEMKQTNSIQIHMSSLIPLISWTFSQK